jgi:hypothetical protein
MVGLQHRTVVELIVVALAVYVLLPQVGRLQQTLRALRLANLRWACLAVLFSALTYVAGAAAIMAAAGRASPWVGRWSYCWRVRS